MNDEKPFEDSLSYRQTLALELVKAGTPAAKVTEEVERIVSGLLAMKVTQELTTMRTSLEQAHYELNGLRARIEEALQLVGTGKSALDRTLTIERRNSWDEKRPEQVVEDFTYLMRERVMAAMPYDQDSYRRQQFARVFDEAMAKWWSEARSLVERVKPREVAIVDVDVPQPTTPFKPKEYHR